MQPNVKLKRYKSIYTFKLFHSNMRSLFCYISCRMPELLEEPVSSIESPVFEMIVKQYTKRQFLHKTMKVSIPFAGSRVLFETHRNTNANTIGLLELHPRVFIFHECEVVVFQPIALFRIMTCMRYCAALAWTWKINK